MPTEYVIQKRGLAVWQYVTWYSDRTQAEENFKKLKSGNGYSYRLVELNVLAECINEPDGVEVRKVLEPDHSPEHELKIEPVKGSWGESTPTVSWGNVPSVDFDEVIEPKDRRGLHFVGTVWICNKELGFKKRMPQAEANALLSQPGYFKGGPRTVV